MVPVVDLSRRGQRFASAFATAAERIAASGSFLLGAELSAFETEFAEWLGAQHCVAVSSGAGALQLALAAAGIGPGDEVFVPAFTAVPTASAVAAVGAIPRAIDVDPATACITTANVAAARTARTKAVIVVHLYGYPAELPDTDLLVDRGRRAGPRRAARPRPLDGDGVQLLPDEEPRRDRRRRCRRHQCRRPRRTSAHAPRSRDDRAVRARARVAELPDVGARGGVVAPGAGRADSRRRATASDRRPLSTSRPATCVGRSDHPEPRLPSRRVSQRRSRRDAAPRSKPTASPPRSTIRWPSPSSRRTAICTTRPAPKPRPGPPSASACHAFRR